MTMRNSLSDRGIAQDGVQETAFRFPPRVTDEMIASNSPEVAPNPDTINIIDDAYEFAAKLRA